MVVGHVAASSSHMIERPRTWAARAAVAQLPMAAVMVGLTITGPTLLLSV